MFGSNDKQKNYKDTDWSGEHYLGFIGENND